jgi:hypothetical protein
VLGQLLGKKLTDKHGTNNTVKLVCGAFRNAIQYTDGSASIADEDDGSWWKVYKPEERQATQ